MSHQGNSDTADSSTSAPGGNVYPGVDVSNVQVTVTREPTAETGGGYASVTQDQNLTTSEEKVPPTEMMPMASPNANPEGYHDDGVKRPKNISGAEEVDKPSPKQERRSRRWSDRRRERRNREDECMCCLCYLCIADFIVSICT